MQLISRAGLGWCGKRVRTCDVTPTTGTHVGRPWLPRERDHSESKAPVTSLPQTIPTLVPTGKLNTITNGGSCCSPDRKKKVQGEGHPSGSWDIWPRLGSAEITILGADLLRNSTGPTVHHTAMWAMLWESGAHIPARFQANPDSVCLLFPIYTRP